MVSSSHMHGLAFATDGIDQSTRLVYDRQPYVPSPAPGTNPAVAAEYPAVVNCLRQVLESNAARTVARTYLYNMLSRNNWRNEDFEDLVKLTADATEMLASQRRAPYGYVLTEAAELIAVFATADITSRVHQLAEGLSPAQLNETRMRELEYRQLLTELGNFKMHYNQQDPRYAPQHMQYHGGAPMPPAPIQPYPPTHGGYDPYQQPMEQMYPQYHQHDPYQQPMHAPYGQSAYHPSAMMQPEQARYEKAQRHNPMWDSRPNTGAPASGTEHSWKQPQSSSAPYRPGSRYNDSAPVDDDIPMVVSDNTAILELQKALGISEGLPCCTRPIQLTATGEVVYAVPTAYLRERHIKYAASAYLRELHISYAYLNGVGKFIEVFISIDEEDMNYKDHKTVNDVRVVERQMPVQEVIPTLPEIDVAGPSIARIGVQIASPSMCEAELAVRGALASCEETDVIIYTAEIKGYEVIHSRQKEDKVRQALSQLTAKGDFGTFVSAVRSSYVPNQVLARAEKLLTVRVNNFLKYGLCVDGLSIGNALSDYSDLVAWTEANLPASEHRALVDMLNGEIKHFFTYRGTELAPAEIQLDPSDIEIRGRGKDMEDVLAGPAKTFAVALDHTYAVMILNNSEIRVPDTTRPDGALIVRRSQCPTLFAAMNAAFDNVESGVRRVMIDADNNQYDVYCTAMGESNRYTIVPFV